MCVVILFEYAWTMLFMMVSRAVAVSSILIIRFSIDADNDCAGCVLSTGNGIKDDGAARIMENLQSCPNITILDLSSKGCLVSCYRVS
jgi:hypothetical protein